MGILINIDVRIYVEYTVYIYIDRDARIVW